MSSDPNNKIDDLLKRYVKKRREESPADFELHPATRRLLQGEVARVFPKSETTAKPARSFALWPRLTLAASFTAMLVAALLVLNQPQKSKSNLASSQSAKEVFSESPAPTKRGIRDETVSLSDGTTDKKDFYKLDSRAPSPALMPEPRAAEREIAGVTATGAITENSAETKWSKTPSQTALIERDNPASPRPDTATGSAQISYYYAVTNGIDTVQERAARSIVTDAAAPASASVSFSANAVSPNRSRFVQQDLRAKYRQNLLSPAQPAILQSFEVARAGNKIQLFDSDGSVYEGEILSAATDPLALDALKQKKEQTADFAFQVAGTNQQINRFVTFYGNFAVTNGNRARADTPAKTADDFQSGAFSRQSGVAGNGLINGKVSIGGTNQFEIQATESPP